MGERSVEEISLTSTSSTKKPRQGGLSVPIIPAAQHSHEGEPSTQARKQMTYSNVVSSGVTAAATKPTAAPTDSSLKMVIFNDHEDQIAEEHSQLIQNHLATSVVERMKNRPEKPLVFDSILWRNGIITVNCEDDFTKAWLIGSLYGEHLGRRQHPCC